MNEMLISTWNPGSLSQSSAFVTMACKYLPEWSLNLLLEKRTSPVGYKQMQEVRTKGRGVRKVSAAAVGHGKGLWLNLSAELSFQ